MTLPLETGSPATLTIEPVKGLITCRGNWTLEGVARLNAQVSCYEWPSVPETVILHVAEIENLDTVGAWRLHKISMALQEKAQHVNWSGLRPAHQSLLNIVTQHIDAVSQPPSQLRNNPLEQIGRFAWRNLREIYLFLAFLGETSIETARALSHPACIRWKALFATIYSAGLNAMPIVGLMSFLIGIVLAYQGGSQLRLYGANIFIVDLVGITLLRELAPMLTAIMIAGRTGSAFTAQIATMKITDEIDALRTIGITPMTLLVTPKLLALILALPLLTAFADIMGLMGGMLVASISLDVNMGEFLTRLQSPLMLSNYIIGIAKTPVFAIIVVLIGCYQGFRVSGGADSVGKQVTTSVVQAIFLVIMADAVFSVLLSWLGV